MKKLISIALIIVLALSLLAACGGGTSNGDSNASSGDSNAAGGGNASSGDSNAASGGGNAAGGGSAASSDGEWVSLTLGVTAYLGRLVDGVPPLVNFMAADGVYNVLFYNDPVTGEVYSEILEELYMEDDTTWILKLKPGVYFSNGDEATADDVVFSFLHYEMRNSPKLANYGLVHDECVARDKYTAVLTTARPFPSFTDNTISLYNKSWAEEVGFDSTEWHNPVGSGPYYCYEYVMDDHITLRLRDDYWDAANSDYYVDEWVIRFYPDPSTMYMDLEMGNIDWCEVSSTDYSRYVSRGGDGFECLPMMTGVINYFSFGFICTDIWDDIEVRKAMAYGVNWQELGQAEKEDLNIPATSSMSAKSPFHIDVGTYEFDPDRAKQILADAGYQPGDINVYLFMMDQPVYKILAEGLQYYCSQIGINVTIDYGDNTAAQTLWTGDTPPDGGFMEFIAGSLVGDPLWVYGLVVGEAGYKWLMSDDPVYRQDIFDAVYCTDPDLQRQRYHALQQKVHDEYLIMPINEGARAYGYNTSVFTRDQMEKNTIAYNYLWVSKLGRSSSW